MTSGGRHSDFTMGVLKGIFKYDPEMTDWTKIAGISAGALLGAKISQIEKQDYPTFIKTLDHLMNSNVELCKPWSSLGRVMGYVKAIVWHDSLFKSSIMDIVRPEWSDSTYRQLYVGAYNETKGYYESFGPKPTMHHVAASASVPVAFHPVQIDQNDYCDGGVCHIIPVKEMKKYWTSGTLDLVICYPTDFQSFVKACDSPSKFKIFDKAWRSITESQWINLNRDLDEIERFTGVNIRNGGTFKVGEKTLRVYIPKQAIYCDFINRDEKGVQMMHQHGMEVAKQVL